MRKICLCFHFFIFLVGADEDFFSVGTKEDEEYRKNIVQILRQFRQGARISTIHVEDDIKDYRTGNCGRFAKEVTPNQESALQIVNNDVCTERQNDPYVGMALEVYNFDDCEDLDDSSVSLQNFDPELFTMHYELTEALVLQLGTTPKHKSDYAYTPALTSDIRFDSNIFVQTESQISVTITPSTWWLWWFVFMSSKPNVKSDGDRYKADFSFAGGSHGEVWRGRRQCRSNEGCDDTKNTLILKRLKVEQGMNLLEAGLREIYFGNILGRRRRSDSFFTTYVDHFFRRIPGQSFLELWIVFEDAGNSLSSFIYQPTTSPEGFVVFQHSYFWKKLRMASSNPRTSTDMSKNDNDATSIEIDHSFESKNQQQRQVDKTVGRQILREVLRQILESAARLGDGSIVHRDIKPSNVMCKSDVDLHDLVDSLNPNLSAINCILGDFSSAWDKFSDQNLYSNGPSKEQQTLEYSPPEALIGNPWVPFNSKKPESYDSWSIGVLALELLLGTPNIFTVDQTTVLLTNRMEKKGASHEDIQRALYLAALSQFCIFVPSSSSDGDSGNWPMRHGDPLHKTSMVKQSCTIKDFHQALRARDPLGIGFDSSLDPLLHLIWNLLAWDPLERMSPSEALRHPFFTVLDLKQHKLVPTVDNALESLMLDPRMDIRSTDTVDSFVCPKCGRSFEDWRSCHTHANSRRHAKFCTYDRTLLPLCLNAHNLLPEHPFSGYCDIQGRRRTIEDFHAIQLHPDHHFYGVFDGHTGNLAPKFVSSTIYGMLQNRFSNISAESKFVKSWKDDAFQKFSEIFEEIHQQFLKAVSISTNSGMDQSGTTATIIYMNRHVVLIASVGDSRAILSSKDEIGKLSFLQLTEDHVASNKKERELVIKRGGIVSKEGSIYRVNGSLAVTRSIGDSALSQYLSREPNVVAMTRSEMLKSCGLNRCFVVLASDGLWDVMSNQEVVDMVDEVLDSFNSTQTVSWKEGGAFQEAAERLTQEAYVRGSTDNIGVCVVSID